MAAAVTVRPVQDSAFAERFAQVYREHLRPVWRMLRRLGVPDAALDDAAQDVFVTAYRRFHDFEGRSTLRTWLLGIALRVASDHRRRVRVMEPVSTELPGVTPGPDAAAERAQAVTQLLALLARLPEEQREVLVLVELEGYSMPEVVEVTGVNLNTLYTRLRAARQRFDALVQESNR
jgi:RNA polymerase sigma-70 factor (ECF subfamily)